MESVLESQKAAASIAPGLSVFLPTTSPLSGGLMLRIYQTRPTELLLPNPFGAGVLVAPPDRLDDFGFAPSAFDRVMIRRIIALKPVRISDVRDSVRATALSGFAGREAQVLARAVAAISVRRRRMLRDQIVATVMRRNTSPDLPDWLTGVLMQTGLNPHDLSSVLCPPARNRAPGGKKGGRAADRDGEAESRLPPRLRLLREVIGNLPDILPPDYNGTSAGRCLRLAENALTRMEALYTGLAECLLVPDRLAGLVPAGRPFATDLGLLAGWTRFCLMAREVMRAPSRAHAVADLTALAQVLGHKNNASAQDAPVLSTARPSPSGWPREIDHALYLSERNERMLRAEITLDVRDV